MHCSVPQRSGWSPAPAGFAPSIDWQMQQAADFADLRQVLDSLKNILFVLFRFAYSCIRKKIDVGLIVPDTRENSN